jgi:[NiFe] hydrogenase assembly HybE family chaperone
MSCPAYLTAALEAAFIRIQCERMADVPLLNPDLAVQAVGFRDWEGYCLGVLITPWFMNLMLFPEDGTDWSGLPSGTRINHVFPSGNYAFIHGEEEGIGHYQMCSLFSPVFEFQTQEAAVATAKAVMEGLMDKANRAEIPTQLQEIRKIRGGEDGAPGVDAIAEGEAGQRPTLTERITQPMSRRDILRGAFLAGKK